MALALNNLQRVNMPLKQWNQTLHILKAIIQKSIWSKTTISDEIEEEERVACILTRERLIWL